MELVTMLGQSGIQIAQEQVDDLLKSAYDCLADGQVTFGEVVTLGGVLGSKVNRFAQLSGPQKQAVVLQIVEGALQKVLTEKVGSLPEDQQEAFREKVAMAGKFAKETLPSVLQLAVQVAKGAFDFGSIVQNPHVQQSVLSGCFALLRCAGVKVETPSTVPELPLQRQDTIGHVLEHAKEKVLAGPEQEIAQTETRPASTVSQ